MTLNQTPLNFTRKMPIHKGDIPMTPSIRRKVVWE